MRGEHDKKDATIASLQRQLSTAQAEVEATTRELEALQQFVLPSALVDNHSDVPEVAGSTQFQVAVQRMRWAAKQLRLACEAKFETFGMLQQQLRLRLDSTTPTLTPRGRSSVAEGSNSLRNHPPAAPPAEPMPAAQAVAPAGSTSGELLQLRAELQQARADVDRERARADRTEKDAAAKLTVAEEDRLKAGKEMESIRRALRVREVEVKELQLIGKYFAGRDKTPAQPEIELAALAEELRSRCNEQSQEIQRLRAERDLLRVERDRSERTRPRSGDRGSMQGGIEASFGRPLESSMASRILEQRQATVWPTSSEPMPLPLAS
eukprot:gnl/TRDRNA2_/TRDRNA2_41554_c1_seq1.p1 gnl/TRDRNA2_/TRDRNA2_41554_c1~~gnl/TRDRNA2_/TRDRNA2_41554_c1_seq1.p1  ORF type:complete len:331 (+),score=84.85 gnl/TRDRNA2_/TRDRNA2_41554_c1_seq1:26-994(+)